MFAELFKKIRINMVISAVFTIILGIVLIAAPEASATFMVYMAAAMLLIRGIADIVGYFSDRDYYGKTALIVGILAVVVAMLLFVKRDWVLTVLTAVFGAVVFVHGVIDIRESLRVRDAKLPFWKAILCFGILSIILGLICVADGVNVLQIGLIAAGVLVLIDGLTDLITAIYISRKAKELRDFVKEGNKHA